MIDLKNIDCMDYMATLPDKAFELAIVDSTNGSYPATPNQATAS